MKFKKLDQWNSSSVIALMTLLVWASIYIIVKLSHNV